MELHGSVKVFCVLLSLGALLLSTCATNQTGLSNAQAETAIRAALEK